MNFPKTKFEKRSHLLWPLGEKGGDVPHSSGEVQPEPAEHPHSGQIQQNKQQDRPQNHPQNSGYLHPYIDTDQRGDRG